MICEEEVPAKATDDMMLICFFRSPMIPNCFRVMLLVCVEYSVVVAPAELLRGRVTGSGATVAEAVVVVAATADDADVAATRVKIRVET